VTGEEISRKFSPLFIKIYPVLKSGFETEALNTYLSTSNPISKEPLPNRSPTIAKRLKKNNKDKDLLDWLDPELGKTSKRSTSFFCLVISS